MGLFSAVNGANVDFHSLRKHGLLSYFPVFNISAMHSKQTNNVCEGGGEDNLCFMVDIKLPLDNQGGCLKQLLLFPKHHGSLAVSPPSKGIYLLPVPQSVLLEVDYPSLCKSA